MLEMEEEVVAAVAWARQAGANGAAGMGTINTQIWVLIPPPLPGGWQIESATNRCEEEQQHHHCREPRLDDKRRLVSSHTYMTIERPGVAHDLRGGALGLCLGAGGEEVSGVEKSS